MITVLLPWKFRRYVLNKYFLYNIAPTARIGLSFIYPKHLTMGEGATIGHLNVAINLDCIIMGKNCIISRSNWITGYPTDTDSPHFAHDKERRSELIMGDESSITKKHHIDCTNSVFLGEFAAIGGYDTQILTHSVDMMECRQDSHPIIIGKYSLVATRSIITGGAQLPAFSVLCAGAYLGKHYEEEWKMYAGVPARPIKDIPREAKRFHRTQGYII
ncbi:MAG: acyltransferase [Bacteroidaceae bacterium]|nr:acyltransferase [Bacteroidaceae bacterium]